LKKKIKKTCDIMKIFKDVWVTKFSWVKLVSHIWLMTKTWVNFIVDDFEEDYKIEKI
jgi:hypothetical protein